jgi:hypothetical protein
MMVQFLVFLSHAYVKEPAPLVSSNIPLTWHLIFGQSLRGPFRYAKHSSPRPSTCTTDKNHAH